MRMILCKEGVVSFSVTIMLERDSSKFTTEHTLTLLNLIKDLKLFSMSIVDEEKKVSAIGLTDI